MYQILFKHYWLQTVRSPGYYKNLVVNIFAGAVALYFLVLFVLLGLMLPKMLQEIVPQEDPAVIFHGCILYALIILLLIRYVMQPLSRLNLESYQVLPVKRSVLVTYLVLKPLLNPLNYLVLCLVIPFAVTGIYPLFGIAGAFRFIFIILGLIWFNTLMAPLLKRQFNNILLGVILFLLVAGALAALEYFKIFSLFALSQHLFGFLNGSPVVWISVWLLGLLAFLLNKSFFARNYYPEVERKNKKIEVGTQRFTFMERFGKIGELISLEIKLVLRHKRTKSTLYAALFFLLYGLIFYPNPMYNESPNWLLFVAIFVTGTGKRGSQ